MTAKNINVRCNVNKHLLITINNSTRTKYIYIFGIKYVFLFTQF